MPRSSSFPMPTVSDLQEAGALGGLDISEADAARFRDNLFPFFDMAGEMLTVPDYLPEVTYPRTPGYRPEGEENRYNAWYYKTSVKGAPGGRLAGKTVALKDNVMLAGVPMMNGASMLEGFTPEIDATIVTRMLDEGAEITGKAHCEFFCLSSGSQTNATGPCHNPHRIGHTAGGSSSGSAALVAAGEVDMSIGGDQAGSIRMPAAFCGVYGMKPTHGLVPYSGILGMEATIDHTGPMTNSVADNALLLEVLAGPDGMDGRQVGVQTHAYTQGLDAGIKGMRIGVVKEGFGLRQSEAAVDAKVKAAAEKLAALGAEVEEISVPLHAQIGSWYMPMLAEGMARQMFYGGGVSFGLNQLYPPGYLTRAASWKDRANEFPVNVTAFLLYGSYLMKVSKGRLYGKGINLRRKARAIYDEVFGRYDLLAMPTVPMTAQKHAEPTGSWEDWLAHSWDPLPNTSPYNYTGLPSMSLPCGMVDGLPVGLMLTANAWQEPTIYRAAYAFEQAGDWKAM